MRIGYFDCFAGASGDMILGCLFDLGLTQADLVDGISEIGLGSVEVSVSDVMRNGIRAKSFSVSSQADSAPRTFRDIVTAVRGSNLEESIKARSLEAFDLLAEAESRIHGGKKDDVHFHEVGALDSIVDVVGAFIGLERLGIEEVTSSELALGTGSVSCDHGVLPVPAPATLEIAKGLPVRSWHVASEFTTPTGAAILRTCVSEFGSIPSMKVTDVGYGAGSRELEGMPNIMRLIVGEHSSLDADRTVLVETNIDDMNPQFFSHLYDDLFGAGALDVWVTSVIMKKGRPGFVLSVLCEKVNVPGIANLVLSETTTSGVRLTEVSRMKLRRRVVEVETKYGRVKAKVFTLDSKTRCAPEYDDCRRLAREKDVSVDQVIEETRNAFRRSGEVST